YAFSSLFSSVNIGYRHLLPILPCLIILAGDVCTTTVTNLLRLPSNRPERYKYVLTAIVISLLTGSVFAAIHAAPSPLEYFNALAGGRTHGYHYLVDSNLDWGQSLWDLRTWMTATGVERVKYAHYSPASPSQYGIQADFLPPDPRSIDFTPWLPDTGIYVIGATVLQGVYAPDINTYAYFRGEQPLARIGGALFIYSVTASIKPAWAVVCDWEPTADEIRKNLSDPALRVIRNDCDDVQVFPGNSQEGLYILEPAQRHLITGEHQFDLNSHSGRVWRTVVSVEDQPEPTNPVNQPIDGPLDFLGYSLDNKVFIPGMELHLETYWRVNQVPDRPLSILAQLVTPNGSGNAVGDGLGFPIELWLPGDMIVQTHKLSIPETVIPNESIFVVTGGYWLDTMERWSTGNPDNLIVLQELSHRKLNQ
ncbi:MAG: hypothetical protein P1S60_10815, partial [Anaerolineae bacterium]|nr:hypothetical protein [Anaerolineae bacterium]